MAQEGYDFDADFEKFREELPQLLAEHQGELAIYHGGERVRILTTIAEAMESGDTEFGRGQFSVQKIAREEVERLSYSLAV